ncbi:MAG: fibronectin type III domain-containing protein [Deinococcota bacterium]
MKPLTFLGPLLAVLLMACGSDDDTLTVIIEPPISEVALTFDDSEAILSDPMLQLPEQGSVRVVWYSEAAGSGHEVIYGEDLNRKVSADSVRMSRMFEDEGSQLESELSSLQDRDVWRHEAVVTGLTADTRVPYVVRSMFDGELYQSDEFSLQPLPTTQSDLKILLTSDQQNRAMSPANFQKVIETVGMVDGVFFAGDLVDNPHRASEWFDRNNEVRPAFFPALQGEFQDLFPEHSYTGGEILQNAWFFGTIGNHETPGRWRPDERTIGQMDGDPQPRWYAEMRYDQLGISQPHEQWVRDNSYEFTAYFEMWEHPSDGPEGESYYAYRLGDVFVISMNVSRVWRNWNPNIRGKFTEDLENLNNPDEWGFGDMFFADYAPGSTQYAWLQEVMASPEFQNAEYRVLLAHQTMFGLGDNSLPVMANPVVTIEYEEDGARQTLPQFSYPVSREFWENTIQPLVDAEAITYIQYEYPIENDLWQNEIEPLLIENGVQLVHTGHSHVWNRAKVDTLNYIETSNVGNCFGAGFDGYAERAPWARFPEEDAWNEEVDPITSLTWDASDYLRTGDAHGRSPIAPTDFNPMGAWLEDEDSQPFMCSNDITAFTILDTGTGLVTSYAFDTRDPSSEVVKFDEFSLR